MIKNIKAGDYNLMLYHNIFTGVKILYYNTLIILETPAVFWETSSIHEFELKGERYNLETTVYWYGGCDYKITHKLLGSNDCLLFDVDL